MKEYETIDISGDVGLKIYGNDLSGIFVNAARGLYSLITETSSVRAERDMKVRAAGDTPESLLVAFLNELIFYFDTDGFIGRAITINRLYENSVVATVSGEEFDIERHERRLLLKAATYHKVSVRKSGGIWTASVIFDI